MSCFGLEGVAGTDWSLDGHAINICTGRSVLRRLGGGASDRDQRCLPG